MPTLQLVHITELQTALSQDGLWSQTRPRQDALSSNQPFSIDTLEIEQWLQFIFIPKITAMLKSAKPLPNGLLIKPIAEQSFKVRNIRAPLVLKAIDTIDKQFLANNNA